MGQNALVYIASIGDFDEQNQELTSGYNLQAEVHVRNNGVVVPYFTSTTFIDGTESAAEVNRKVVASAQADILEVAGINIPARDILLFAQAN